MEKFTSHVMLVTYENLHIIASSLYNVLRVLLRSSIFFVVVLLYCFKSLAFLSSLATSLDRNRRWQRTQNQFETVSM